VNRNSPSQCLVNWDLEGSNDDGKTWHVIDTRRNEQVLMRSKAWYVFFIDNDVQNNNAAYSMFRIKLAGPNSSGSNNISLTTIEFFGKLQSE
jgi:hypothetical protein